MRVPWTSWTSMFAHPALLLLGALLFSLPPCLVRVGKPDVRFHMEVITFLTSQETWLRAEAGEPDAWRHPTGNGWPRLNKPPLTIWLNFLAWSGLDRNTDIEILVQRSRLVGVGMAIMTLAAVFWLGLRLTDRRRAFLAALITGSMLLMIRQARICSYDTHLVGWVTLSVALGFRAASGPAARPSQWLFGLLAGVAAAAAVLTKGPLALLLSGLPLLAMARVLEAPRGWRYRRVALVLAVGILAALPWYLYLALEYPDAWRAMFKEYRAERATFQPPWYYLGLVALVFPWSLWFAASLFHPFMVRGEERRRILLPWVWLVALFVVLSVPAAKQQRYIVPVLPAAALMVLQFWFDSAYTRHRLTRHLPAIHWGLLLACSAGFGAFILGQPWWKDMGWIKLDILPVETAWPTVAVTTVLLILAGAGFRLHARGRTGVALLVTALWMSCAATFGFYHYVDSFHGRYEEKDECRRLAALMDGHPAYFLWTGRLADHMVDTKFLVYSRRVIAPITPDEALRLPPSNMVFIVSRAVPEHREVLARTGFEPVYTFDDPVKPRLLFVRPKTDSAATARPAD